MKPIKKIDDYLEYELLDYTDYLCNFYGYSDYSKIHEKNFGEIPLEEFPDVTSIINDYDDSSDNNYNITYLYQGKYCKFVVDYELVLYICDSYLASTNFKDFDKTVDILNNYNRLYFDNSFTNSFTTILEKKCRDLSDIKDKEKKNKEIETRDIYCENIEKYFHIIKDKLDVNKIRDWIRYSYRHESYKLPKCILKYFVEEEQLNEVMERPFIELSKVIEDLKIIGEIDKVTLVSICKKCNLDYRHFM